MCFLFRLDLSLYAGVGKKFRIFVFATKHGHSFDEEVDGGISMTAYQLDTPVRKPRSLSYGACVSRTLAVQVSFVASHRIAIACVFCRPYKRKIAVTVHSLPHGPGASVA